MLQNISRTKVWMFLFSLLSLKIENHFFLFFQNRLDPSGSPQKISFWNIGSKCIHPFWMEGRNKINLVLPKKFPSPTVWSASHSSTLQLAECCDVWQKIMESILKTTNCRFFFKTNLIQGALMKKSVSEILAQNPLWGMNGAKEVSSSLLIFRLPGKADTFVQCTILKYAQR